MAPFHPCSLVGLFLLLASTLLLIFAQIGQTSTSSLSRSIRLVSLDLKNFGVGLDAATGKSGNLTEIYAAEGTVPSGNGVGIATEYEWGLWSYCDSQESIGSTSLSQCSKTSFGHRFEPLTVLLSDTPTAYLSLLVDVLPSSTFTDNHYLGSFSNTAFYFIFIQTLMSGLALILGFGAHRFAYFFSGAISFLGGILGAVGAIIWTVLISKVKRAVNDLLVTGGVSLGMKVEFGEGMWLIWSAVAIMLAASMPISFACLLERGGKDYY